MCFGGSPSAPPPPPPPAIVKTPAQPKLASEGVRKAQSDAENKAKQVAATRGGTLITGPGGLLAPALTQKKTLLGL